MNDRKGEKYGWIGGWIGGFLWVIVFAGFLVIQKRYFMSAISLSIFTVAVILIVYLAPWKHPDVQYWKLLLPIYAMLVGAVIVLLACFGFPGKVGYSWWSVLWLLPTLLPFRTAANRTWDETTEEDDQQQS